MNKIALRPFFPHLIALFLFIILSYIYFIPVVEGRELVAHDTDSWRSMAQETIEYNSSHDDVTLWTNSMFGGMPVYQISMVQPNNVLQYVENIILAFPRPVSNAILYLLCFYIMLLAFGLKSWQAVVGAIGFTFASYNFIIIAAGHNSKAITIAYMAPLIGAVFLSFRKKLMLGGILTALFLSLAIRANHIQILYYTLIILLFFVVAEFIYSIKDKKIVSFLKTVGVLFVAVVIALAMNATSLLTTYEYSQYTMRGKSNNLTPIENNNSAAKNEGLNKDYITQWSYGVDETMTLLIPNFKGGASGGSLSENSETAKYLKNLGVSNEQIKQITSQMPLYWGTQPFTSGPVYLGAIVIFLFVLSLFLVNKRILYWTIPAIVLTLMLSWGRNFMPLTDFFIDYVPLYNKFRTVSMILVATGFLITLLAFLAMKEVYEEKYSKEKLTKNILISVAITVGILLLFILFPSLAGNFVSLQDNQFSGDYSFLQNTLPLDRKSLLRADAWRSVAFIVFGGLTLLLYVKGLLKKNVSLVMLGFFILLDLFPIAKRYLNDDNFQAQRPKQLIQASPADEMILQDKSEFRIIDATTNIFNDASPSYFHKNIGGYHAAKLSRYQELIDRHIEKELGTIFNAFGNATSPEDITKVFSSLNVCNMLNLKYIIYNKQAPPLENPFRNGNAWFVKKMVVAENADEEMKLLGKIDIKNELVVDKSLASALSTVENSDTSATISLKSYRPNHLIYSVNSATEQVAVFSEIFYDKGWIATINGEEIPYTRVNYLLRGMSLKAGNYEVEFKFNPSSYSVGNTIAMIGSITLILIFIIGLYFYISRQKKIEK